MHTHANTHTHTLKKKLELCVVRLGMAISRSQDFCLPAVCPLMQYHQTMDTLLYRMKCMVTQNKIAFGKFYS